jgi:hypothetical protein
MAPTTHRRTVTVILCAVALAAVSGCGGGGDATTSTPTTSTTPAASAGGQTYSSKAFVVPLTVTVDAALKSPPNPDSPNLLSWDAAASDVDNAVRFFVPVIIYPPDYLQYLQSQTKNGAEFSKVTKLTVDGHPATLMNVTTSRPEGFLSGSIGCSERTADKHDGDRCRGIQPDNIVRLSDIDLGETTLLAWARMHKDNPDPAFVAMFERMLTTVRFR